ncbi:putative fatty acid methyltransferase [Frankliniella fusca]|uniref:Fatty acid methyltransferase n=1 Tax=Frankliniella fusca TaxID=407009 RepID=A0AAE1HEF7_9NEOP|nr:putative fatty acid methyltransferase [Frankliniella fusca]
MWKVRNEMETSCLVTGVLRGGALFIDPKPFPHRPIPRCTVCDHSIYHEASAFHQDHTLQNKSCQLHIISTTLCEETCQILYPAPLKRLKGSNSAALGFNMSNVDG